jgi:putative glutamine amidotransferase
MKPKIGITTGCQNPLEPKDFARLQNYLKAIESSEGEPLLLVSTEFSSSETLNNLDGLMLTGGGDIPSYFWGEVTNAPIKPKDENRARFELPLVHYAQMKEIPIFGICLGLQAINVSLGGTLHIDLPSPLHKWGQNENPSELRHNIEVIPGTQISKIFPPTLKVNSRHHQAVKDLAPGIKVCAKAEDGVVEAIESAGDQWIVGVQWHPEDLIQDETQLGIFKAFIKACQKKRNKEA